MMTPQEQALAEDIFAVLKKHGVSLSLNPSSPTGGKKFLVSMIGFNNLQLSKNCIESVLANTTPGIYDLRLTNNGSKDGTSEYFDQMASQFPHVSVVHNEENEGFQVPNEASFKYAKERGYKYMVCLNNDAEVPAGWLEKLAEPLDASEKAVLSGPMTGCSRMNERLQGCDDTKLEFIEGSCLCIKVDTVHKEWGRLFAPYLSFIYHEDSDLSLRVQYAGYTIAKVPFRIKHKGSQTAGAHPEAKKKCAEANKRNEALMLVKYAHWNKVRRFDHPIIVKREYAVGDVLLTTPIIRALANKYRLCPIYVETGAPDIFKNNPHVKMAAPKIAPMADAMVIDLNNAYERTPGRHVLESYAEAAGLGMDEVVDKRLTIHSMRNVVSAKWCAVHIGPTTWEGKNWPNDRWNKVIQYIRSKGFKVMLFGNPPKDAQFLVDADHRGQSGIQDFAQIMYQCSLFVGLDSFPAHLASALNIPSVVLYGITDPKCFCSHTGKHINVTSDPSHPDTGRRNREANVTFIQTTDAVMRTISVDDVMRAVDKITA